MNSRIRRIGLVLKRHDPRVHAVAAEIIPWLQDHGVEIFLDDYSARECLPGVVLAPARDLPGLVDMVTVFGGDGTMLYASRIVAASGVPILGVNLGSLGFLTEVKLEEMRPVFEGVLAGRYRLEERIMLQVEVIRAGNSLAVYLALNDAVINKGALARIIDLEVTVSGQLVSLVRADGLIISTPTGSTAYSLSAGGPILYPSLGAVIVTPICPHTLTNRPVVVPDDVVVEVCMRHGTDMMLTVDGQVGMPLEASDLLRIRKSQAVIRLVQPAGNTFFKLLREKLKWG